MLARHCAVVIATGGKGHVTKVGMVAENLGLGSAAVPAGRADQVRLLLVEDDDGDALLVTELLAEQEAPVTVRRVRTLAEAKPLLPEVSCVLLDLGLPDSEGLDGVRWLRENQPQVAVVVLTGMADEYLGEAAVRAGAQDYTVKSQVTGRLLYRVIRYAVERRRAEETQRQLYQARIFAAENVRLERGLLPSPVLRDPRMTVASRYRPGGQQLLLGGDFYDVVEDSSGWVHAMVGDVSGRGPTEAALGVTLRVAWRTMMLAEQPAETIFSVVRQVLEHERQDERMFATLCMLSVAPDRSYGQLYLAGHPQPILVSRDGLRELTAPVCLPPGISDSDDWPGSRVFLGDEWSVLLYTDGLIEGRVGDGPERLGSQGLMELIEEALREAPGVPGGPAACDTVLLDRVIDQVRELNGGDVDDDIAALALGWPGPGPHE